MSSDWLYREEDSFASPSNFVNRVFRLAFTIYLGIRARVLRQRLTAPDSGTAVVSLTSHGNRVDSVHLVVEAIGRGSVKPARIVLWLNADTDRLGLPKLLQRARTRGVEVCWSPNFGPHTKYFPALDILAENEPVLVTADDDILYPKHWLKGLVEAHARWPGNVLAYRAHEISFGSEELRPYAAWQRVTNSTAGPTVFCTGVSGVLYPPSQVQALRVAGEGFRENCLSADDIWLHWVALRAGIHGRQINDESLHFFTLPGSGDAGLAAENVAGGRNDLIIRSVYSAEDLDRLRGTYPGDEQASQATPSEDDD